MQPQLMKQESLFIQLLIQTEVNKVQYPTHFEMLLVKRNGKWLGVMEYQKSTAIMKEWKVLKK